MYSKQPDELNAFIKAKQSDNYSCNTCQNSCCFESGFAIKQNVELIYKKYQNGDLIRTDYKFKPDLHYEDFVRIYFDVIHLPSINLTLYFPRHIAYDDVALIINPNPDKPYWEHRHNILREPANECKGCIFLESKISQSDSKAKRCILHNSELEDYIYEKPIDCILLSCDSQNRVIKPTAKESEQYFEILSRYFGNNS